MNSMTTMAPRTPYQPVSVPLRVELLTHHVMAARIAAANPRCYAGNCLNQKHQGTFGSLYPSEHPILPPDGTSNSGSDSTFRVLPTLISTEARTGLLKRAGS
jgi:hypothetical protein